MRVRAALVEEVCVFVCAFGLLRFGCQLCQNGTEVSNKN